MKKVMLNQLNHGATDMAPLMDCVDDVLKRRFQHQVMTCGMQTMSEIIRSNPINCIDLLKIDAEKSEADVLVGISHDDWHKIKQLVLEVHDISGRLQRLTALLKGLGYEIAVDQSDFLEDSNLYHLYGKRQD